MKLEPANIVCPSCGNANYMRHLIGNNVGHLDLKCINCNSYFNFDELYKQRTGEALKPKPITNELVKRLRTECALPYATLQLMHEAADAIEEQMRKCDDCPYKEKESVRVDVNLYDKEEIYENCTVQILTNTITGKTSIGWWQND